MKRTFKIFKRIIVIFTAWFICHSLFIINDGFSDNREKADVAVVLGNKINPDGYPSERLKARLDKSIELIMQNRVKVVIVSGGLGKEGFREGDKMKDYLVSKNIPQYKIIIDNYGNDTEKTVVNSISIIKHLKADSAIIVSQYFHHTRTKMLFKKHGFKNIDSSSPNYFEIRDFYSVFREFFAFYAEFF